MNCKQARGIPIPTLLATLGLESVRRDSNGTYYRSPWSISGDRTPSLQVSPDGLVFHDWASGCHGDIIDFVQQYIGQNSVSAALSFLSNQQVPAQLISASYPSRGSRSRTRNSGVVVTRVAPLETKLLLGYLWGRRGIHRTVAMEYCQEIHYHLADRPEKRFFAIGWHNDSGGYELRNAIIKQSIAPKDITTVGDLAQCPYYVFEGFLDFLSAVQLELIDLHRSNAIVLNSTALVGRAIDALVNNGATEVNCLLDNDASGRHATASIRGAFPSAKDYSFFYAAKNCNDVNDLLVATKRNA